MSEENSSLQPVSTPRYGYLKAMYLSLFSPKIYSDVANRWHGFGSLYFLLLMALVTIPVSLRIMIDFNTFFEQQIILPLQKLPPLVIQQGKLQFDKPMPYKIKNDKGEVIIIIDTTGKISKITDKYPDLLFLITKSHIHYRIARPQLFFTDTIAKPAQVTVEPLDKHSAEVFQAKEWLVDSGVYKFKYVAMALIYPLFVTFFFIFYFFTLLVFAFLGQLLAKMFFDLKLKYKEACRLFAVASTPQIVLFFGFFTTNSLFQGIGFVCVALQAIYFSYGVIAVKRSRSALVHR